jgi:tRNA threonylcarbamoyladenosine biosynthesis protein TsaE
VRSFVRAAGGPDNVTSPTYTLMHEYPTPDGTVVHVDAYRLQDARDASSLGLEDATDRARFTLIEWGDRIASALPPFWRLELERPEGEHDVRRARLTPPQGRT